MDPKALITRFLYIGNIDLLYYAKNKTIKLEKVPSRPLLGDQLKSIIEGPKVAHQLFDVVKRVSKKYLYIILITKAFLFSRLWIAKPSSGKTRPYISWFIPSVLLRMTN